ncbi:DUF6792 domain-containing protein [Lentibacillus jeotgali]|uniref:DUF6792 domain-containing protein n=1 Tax=Lentibacillus jeotgali TaxID=558169 RepID=UPI0002627046|nr:DUF6792 domain-containing protein [Lentibacillus jeotgali]
MSEEVMHTQEMRLRLIDLEYKDLSEKELKKEIERIYVEEYGEELSAKIDVFTSSDAESLEDNTSGYDGTAIHFQSEENNIDEVYVISQGTQGAKDWEYNMKAMLAGQDISQADATEEFVNEAKKNFKTGDSTSIIGLSHSLAHNNNTTAHLLYDTFDDIYSVNGAQTNYYQLYNYSGEFRKAISEEFSISPSNLNTIYEINPDKLKAFAKDYYKDKGENIHQIISEDDPLYAVSSTRGFFTLGDVEFVDTNTDYPGLRSIMDDIPDEAVKDLQELAIQYTTASNRGGTDAAVQEILGVDMGLVKQIDGFWSAAGVYTTNQSEIDEMIRDVNDKLPRLLSQVKTVTTNADVIFQRVVDAGYISAEQKQLIVTELTTIQSELDGMMESISRLVDIRDMHNLSSQLGGDLGTYINIKNHAQAIQGSLDKLNTEKFRALLQTIGSGHDITGILESMNKGNKSYLGTDMVLTATKGSGEIQVNISATLRMYEEGKRLLEDKATEIKRMQATIDREVMQSYKTERRKVMNKIYDMEASPSTYTHLLRKHVYFVRLDKSITSINVHEEFYPFNHTNMDDKISLLNESVEKGHTYLENYRSAIQDLFDEEENIAALFDVVEGS